jgi:hypothetical protein
MSSWRYWFRPIAPPVYRQSWLRVLFLFVAPVLTNRVTLCRDSGAAQAGSLSLSSGSGAPGANVTLSVVFQSNGTLPAAMQWDLTYSSSDLIPAAGTFYTTGAAASSAGKSVTCRLVSPGDVRCLAFGMNTTAIASGGIATITFQIASTTDTSVPVSLVNMAAADAGGNPVPVVGTGGTVTINQPAPPVLLSLTCTPTTLAAPGTTSCTATLSSNTTSSAAVALVSGTPRLVTVPSSVNVPSGSSSAGFIVNAVQAVTTSTSVMLNATLSGKSQSSSITITPSTSPPVLQINGELSEVSGVKNGSVVTPAMAPSGFTGKVVANGSGSVNFTPAQAGNGVYFLNCCVNTNNVYYKFTGTTVGNIFNANAGQVSFDLTSRYSFAQRKALPTSRRFAFDVRDGNGTHEFNFLTQFFSGYLQFLYMVGGVEQSYDVPKGTEDTLFGDGVTMQVTIAWSGSTAKLYLNNTLVSTTAYTVPAPNWSAASNFDLGAYEYLQFGGYFSSDDVISGFTAW